MKSWLTAALVVAVVIVALAMSSGTVQVKPGEQWPMLALGEERTVTLEVMWDGDVHRSDKPDCGVWSAAFNCELRRGGGLGVVMSRTLPISATAAVGEPGMGRWGTASVLTWDTSGLDVGDHETFVRLEVTDGDETLYGYMESEGQGGESWFLVDKFHIGQVCFVPMRFSVSK